MARPTVGHLDPTFIEMMEDLKGLLRATFRTDAPATFPVSGPGSAGMEACFVNLVSPGETVVIGRNGVFGSRMASIVERLGATPVLVDAPWGRPVDPDAIRRTLGEHPRANTLAFVHAETSTGARSDAETLAKIAAEHECLTIVDTVTSLGGCPVEVQAWGLDAVYSGSQKCLSCAPGLSPVTFSPAALARRKAMAKPAASWFLDLELVLGYWDGQGGRSYHHTAPINSLYGLHEALCMLHEEGLEAAWARHAHHHRALAAGLEALGLHLVVPPAHRLWQLNAVAIPEGIDDKQARALLLHDYGLEIGGGLGDFAGKVWRIGLMGTSASRANVMSCLTALQAVLSRLGHAPADEPTRVAAAVYDGAA